MSNRSTSPGARRESPARPTDAAGAPAQPEPGTPASYLKRFVALLIDWIGCLLIGSAVATVAGLPPVIAQHGFAAYPVLVVEYGIFVGLFGQTVGMRLTGIQCVRADGAGRIGVPRALLRGVLLCLVVPAVLIGRAGRGLHDRAASSVVLHT